MGKEGHRGWVHLHSGCADPVPKAPEAQASRYQRVAACAFVLVESGEPAAAEQGHDRDSDQRDAEHSSPLPEEIGILGLRDSNRTKTTAAVRTNTTRSGWSKPYSH